MNEKWKRWMPLNEDIISGNYYIEEIIYNDIGLIITMESEHQKQKIKITFKDSIWSYRTTDESYCWKIFSRLSKEYPYKLYAEWDFFKITNSNYLEWITDSSGEFHDDINVTHFFIKGLELAIDIIDTEEPKVEFLK
jgi:hypothetical protein